MASVVIISGSPSADARAGILVRHVSEGLRGVGHAVHTISVRDLPTVALLSEDVEHLAIRSAIEAIGRADGVVVASPVYRAAYSGLVKCLLDLLPKGLLAGRVVLPIATGGTQGHVVAIDFALRPLLAAIGATDVLPGHFVLDRLIAGVEEGGYLRALAAASLQEALGGFTRALSSPIALTG
ncbi:FMN reductase [Alloactinosynnema sp. L-07]|uniref:NADPH-dependent FMN reductase n=1 Tax=Alloactinosynnema sp. L-07 TaxID=1653480 RepID=UPI00065F06A4|nr:NADPH-dependent FMN reductase [Alloactinosynnema sp. L-07]CRK61832.1 FMN reductase [Alloactinosynnema sp. L-07]